MGKIGIIISREFNQRVRKRMFIITTILTPLLMVGIMAAVVAFQHMGSSDEKVILVVDNSGMIAPKLQSEGKTVFENTDRPIGELREDMGDAFGILAIGADVMTNPGNVQLFCLKSATVELESVITRQIRSIIEDEKLKEYDIENLGQIMAEIQTNVSMQSFLINENGGEKESSTVLAMVLSLIFGMLIYMFVFMYGAMVMNGVIEEKNSKVLEIMVSSVRPFELMMGKIIGIALVAITQFFIWVVLIVVLGSVGSMFLSGDMTAVTEAMSQGAMMPDSMGGAGEMDMLTNMTPEMAAAVRGAMDVGFILKMLVCFVLYFIGGYLLYASMFAAIGSAADSESDSQQLQVPVTIPLMLALIALMNVLHDPYGSLGFWFSMIPFTSPVIMLARIPYGVPMWEIVLSLVLLYGTFVVMVWLAAKIYRVGIFMYGKKLTWKEIIKWVRYK